jgi:hypothetical protein
MSNRINKLRYNYVTGHYLAVRQERTTDCYNNMDVSQNNDEINPETKKKSI